MIEQQLSRILSAKKKIAEAIELKGVPVPSNAKVDSFPSLIGQISGGAGGWHSDSPIHVKTTGANITTVTITRLIGLEVSYDNNTWVEPESTTIYLRRREQAHPEYIEEVWIRAKYITNGTTAVIKLNGFNTTIEGKVESLIEGNEGKLYPYCFSSCFVGTISSSNTSSTINVELPVADVLPDHCYNSMFSGCSGFTSAPTIVASSCGNYSCNQMFYNCASLTTIQDTLFENTVGQYGCERMFSGCSKLTTIPYLPATSVETYGYHEMFYGCSIADTQDDMVLPATTPKNYAYHSMFYGCSGLTKAPELQFTTGATYLCTQMFRSCTSLTNPPSMIQCTSNFGNIFNNMFAYCNKLEESPVLKLTTLTTGGATAMFSGCTRLRKITLSINTWSTSYATNWVNGVAATGEFHKKAGLTMATGTNGIPSGWTVIEDLE